MFGTVIVLAAGVAGAGFVGARRAFHRQWELSEMKSNFVSSVSHELRAPIASVRLLAESLEQGRIPGQEKQHDYYHLIVQECRRLTIFIENVLDFSRIEQGRKKFEFEPADLSALARQTVQLMEPQALERSIKLLLALEATPNGPLELVCDGLSLQQALVNLIDNALKHAPEGTEISIGLQESDGICRLWVEDHGSGIPAEDHERIFEPFYRRGSELRRETQGVGIGLTIVKHTVEAHGGRVVVRSAVGQGSRFTMELPVKREVVERM